MGMVLQPRPSSLSLPTHGARQTRAGIRVRKFICSPKTWCSAYIVAATIIATAALTAVTILLLRLPTSWNMNVLVGRRCGIAPLSGSGRATVRHIKQSTNYGFRPFSLQNWPARRLPLDHRKSSGLIQMRSSDIDSQDNQEEDTNEACVTEITSVQMLEKILDFHDSSETLVLLEIYADWCRKCKFMLPKFDKECEVQPDVFFVRMNESVDKDYLKTKLGIRGLPCFMLFKNKKRLDMFYASSQDDLQENIAMNM